jgi:hypothetical protein
MKLLNKYPERFFSVLTSINKEAYVAVAKVLYDLEREVLISTGVLKTDFVYEVKEKIGDELMNDSFDITQDAKQEKMDFGDEDMKVLNNRISAIIQLLSKDERGWFVQSFNDAYENVISLSEAASSQITEILNFNDSEKSTENTKLNLYAAYSQLKSMKDTDFKLYALKMVQNNVDNTKDTLRKLVKEVMNLMDTLKDEQHVSEILKTQYDRYLDEIFKPYVINPN